MIDVSISLSDDLRKSLDQKEYDKALDATVLGAAESLRSRIAVYPGPAHKPVLWASAKARRYYFAMRREKGLPLEYTRQSDAMSQRLGPSWATRRAGQAVYIVGTRVTYAKWVQQESNQQRQHQATGWKTDEQAVEDLESSGDIDRIGAQAVAHLTGTR